MNSFDSFGGTLYEEIVDIFGRSLHYWTNLLGGVYFYTF